MTTTLLEPDTMNEVVTKTKPEDCAHIVMDGKRPERDDPHAWVMEARIEGFPVTALCGFTWVPNKMARNLPVCEECKDIYDNEDRSDESGSGMPDE